MTIGVKSALMTTCRTGTNLSVEMTQLAIQTSEDCRIEPNFVRSNVNAKNRMQIQEMAIKTTTWPTKVQTTVSGNATTKYWNGTLTRIYREDVAYIKESSHIGKLDISAATW